MDVVITAARPPRMGETVMGEEIHFLPGGKGANQAAACARLGADCAMIGAVGQDAFGSELVQSLKDKGVHTESISVVPGVSTGTASILLSQGDNCIVVVPGANSRCLPEDIERHRERIAQADIVLLQLEIPLETVVYAARLAKQSGCRVVLNPAPVPENGLPTELLESVDYITPNRSELGLLTGMDTEQDALEAAMERLAGMGPAHVVTTLGADGAAYKAPGAPVIRAAGHRVQVVDTTGAGDAFNAGLACSLASGGTLAEAVAFALKVSALAVTKLGAQTGMPTLAEVRSFGG
jgi:ribokinase